MNEVTANTAFAAVHRKLVADLPNRYGVLTQMSYGDPQRPGVTPYA